MTLRALSFDADGTVADTERDGHRLAFNASFAEAGLSWHWHEALYGELLQVAGCVEPLLHYARVYHGLTDSAGTLRSLVLLVHQCKTCHDVEDSRNGLIAATRAGLHARGAPACPAGECSGERYPRS